MPRTKTVPSSADQARTPPQADRRTGRFALVTAVCVAVATAVNLGLYAVGRGTDATLRVDPGLGDPDHLVVAGDVAWKTALPLLLGAVVLVTIARRPRRWTTTVVVAGAAVAAVSVPFVYAAAHDTVTGVLLAGMHTIAGLAYVLIGVRAHRGVLVDGRS